MESTQKTRRWLGWLGAIVVASVVGVPTARAEGGIPRNEGFMQEPKAVEYRIHTLKGKWDFGVLGALSIKNQLTEHYGAGVIISRNFNEYLALDLMLEGGLGQVTKFTKDLRLQVAEKGTDKTDLADAGALIGTGQIGVRFTPFYGKFSVASELPLHFNFYFNAGVGVAMVKYNGIIGCAADIPGGSTGCPGAPDDPAAYFAETKPAIAGNIGGGLRLYITKLVSARVEFRDVIFQDRYYTGLTLDKAASTRSTLASSPGITHVPLLMLGVGFLL